MHKRFNLYNLSHRHWQEPTPTKPSPTNEEGLKVKRIRRRTEDILEASRLESEALNEVWDV